MGTGYRGADAMRLLATIPDLGPVLMAPSVFPVSPAPAEHAAALPTPVDLSDSAGEAHAAVGSSPLLPRTIRVTPKAAFPWASVAALVACAFTVWSLATWNDAQRLARQQAEERLADRALTAGAEAVLR